MTEFILACAETRTAFISPQPPAGRYNDAPFDALPRRRHLLPQEPDETTLFLRRQFK
jgi:hypothetical protein